MLPWLTGQFGNPSSRHSVGERAAEALESARERVASVLGTRRSDIVFTSGATEADNLAVKGISLAALVARDARHLVTTPIEHEAVLASADYLRRLHGFDVSYVDVDAEGCIAPADVVALMREDTALISIGYANSEIGTVQNIGAIAAALRAAGCRTPLHSDGVQAAGWLDLSRAKGRALEGVDALSLAGHKIGAPAGTGVLAVRSRIPIEPLLHGGGQESGRRSGTEDVAGAVAFATALELAEAERVEASTRVGALRDAFVARVLAVVPSARLTGHADRRLPGNASFTFAGISGEAVLLELERRGVVSSSGSACAAGSSEPSHVLLALGIDPDIAQTSVRFSLSTHQRESLLPVADAVAAAVEAVGR